MTPQHMRENLLQYGGILCLDIQARQCNSSGFPYCSPIAISSKKQKAQTSESLVVEDNSDSYHWISQSMQEMVPHWNVSNILILFGDHKITPSLMTSLGIQKTCLLREDYYHNMNEVVPKNFGEHLLAIIPSYLVVGIGNNKQ
jgi:hypothetical protein